ncbi:MAG: hypothetical protein EHM88_22150, partial [Candidatus Rokuibacteriota bacterium]
LKDSSVWATSTSDLTIDAQATGSIDATVVAAALGVGGGGTTGVAVSGAGSYSENKIYTDVKAYIDGDTPTSATTGGIRAASVAVTADDSSGINAVAGAGSLAVGFGSTAGVAVAVGMSLAFNEVSNNVEAWIVNADQGVITSSGSITISAVSQNQHLFDLTVGGQLTPTNFDDAATADMDDPDDPRNEPILVTPDNPATPEDESKYTGGDDVTSRFDDTVNGTMPLLNEAWEDAEGDRLVLEALREAFALPNNDETLAMYDIVGTAARFRTSDGEQDVREGTTVQLEKGYMAGEGEDGEYDGSKGEEGRVYRYIVMASETDEIANPIDLSTEDYTDTTKWQLVDKLKLSILVAGQKWVLVAPDGKAYVLELITEDGVSKISVSRETINAVSAAASLAIAIGGSGGISVSGAGAVAQNVILTKTNAYGRDSVLNSHDDVTVSAASTSEISAAVVAASLAIGGGGAAGVGASIGISIARNFIGWTPDGTETPAQVQAYLQDASVSAVDDLTLTSVAEQTISSIVFAGSAALAIGGTAGVAVSGSGVWAENKIGVDVKAYIDGDRDAYINGDSSTVGIRADSVTV